LKELLTAGPHLSVSGAKKKRERRACWASGCGVGPHGPTARAGKRNRPTAWGVCGPKRIGEKGERERERRVCPFFSNFFQIHFSNIQTPIKRKPCIQTMMHNHLLSLNYFSDVYLFKSQFV
jgi:hypothetical protein